MNGISLSDKVRDVQFGHPFPQFSGYRLKKLKNLKKLAWLRQLNLK
jgi:hypothetical protein